MSATLPRHGMAYRPGVKCWWMVKLVIGRDVPVVLPAPPIGLVVLTAWLATRGDGLPGHEVCYWGRIL